MEALAGHPCDVLVWRDHRREREGDLDDGRDLEIDERVGGWENRVEEICGRRVGCGDARGGGPRREGGDVAVLLELGLVTVVVGGEGDEILDARERGPLGDGREGPEGVEHRSRLGRRVFFGDGRRHLEDRGDRGGGNDGRAGGIAAGQEAGGFHAESTEVDLVCRARGYEASGR